MAELGFQSRPSELLATHSVLRLSLPWCVLVKFFWKQETTSHKPLHGKEGLLKGRSGAKRKRWKLRSLNIVTMVQPLGTWKWRSSTAQRLLQHPWHQDGVQSSPFQSHLMNTVQHISGVCSMFALYTHWFFFPWLNIFFSPLAKASLHFCLIYPIAPPTSEPFNFLYS